VESQAGIASSAIVGQKMVTVLESGAGGLRLLWQETDVPEGRRRSTFMSHQLDGGVPKFTTILTRPPSLLR
jgi:hypothetical protein